MYTNWKAAPAELTDGTRGVPHDKQIEQFMRESEYVVIPRTFLLAHFSSSKNGSRMQNRTTTTTTNKEEVGQLF